MPSSSSLLQSILLNTDGQTELSANSLRRRGKKREDDSEALERDSYLIFRLVTKGGIGLELDFDAPYLDQEDRETLWYARYLARNFSDSPDDEKRVIFRINARWVDYNGETMKSQRKREEWERLVHQVEHFSEELYMVLGPYRNVRDMPIIQWGMFINNRQVKTKMVTRCLRYSILSRVNKQSGHFYVLKIY
ncbi:hypothetical protein DTO166G4_1514 [Paecilomyces variotii]|nr:hypothetical protein DTO166G4_1514 [Paecilomyces variotii]KAJ9226126.1 hypothetical protein DTO169C6_1339 [Paecilomyces variotii]KAJ9242606.1 hypothetical protein DTO166G5_361 [Paecilomyces variotii]KAJ9266594.1 hypothetical protein DTO195F2_1117 [Paecilomyces variotii]KAJ9329170.1 hypothetical protein DTO027B3_570 [Paecilomyces variotii]